jgi:hypothetical protein
MEVVKMLYPLCVPYIIKWFETSISEYYVSFFGVFLANLVQGSTDTKNPLNNMIIDQRLP